MPQMLSKQEQAAYLYRHSLTLAEIAEVLCTHKETVRQWIVKIVPEEERKAIVSLNHKRTAEAYTNETLARQFVEEYVSPAQPLLRDLCMKYKISYKKGRNFLLTYLTEEQRAEQHNQRVAQARFKKNGQTGERPPTYKGECLDGHGYTTLAKRGTDGFRRVLTHRVVFAEALGLDVDDLPRSLHVHHIDTNPLNNSLDNLALCTPKAHRKLHMQLRAATKSTT